ncbi:MAG: ribosome small subunit-dependent GTPase A [Planctomycetota bacterium]|nr:ribosome small subunit-dependent GTPase A [Planctomycetota bacterium]
MAKNKKIRTEFRKNRTARARATDLTRDLQDTSKDSADSSRHERISGKGDLSRKRTVVGETVTDDSSSGFTVMPEVDLSVCRRGRVLQVFGLNSLIETEDGAQHQCVVRRLLKTLATDQRHVVAAGDWVYFRPSSPTEGIIERIEPRYGILSRTSRGRQHIMVANVDQMIVVASAAEPYLKPHLIDRFIVTAEQNQLRPIICINKIDLVDVADLQPLIGAYSRMGYRVIPISAQTGQGIDLLASELRNQATVVVGQSGVGKSSLLNRIEPGLELRVGKVSQESQKGKHTTTTARLIRLERGGWVVDTPGIRQFQLWDIIPEEVAGNFRDLRPYVSRCKYPNCIHIHETDCAVKDAVADGYLDSRRYESYCQMHEEDSS